MVQGIVTISPVPSCWKIPIPVKVSGLADESICFLKKVWTEVVWVWVRLAGVVLSRPLEEAVSGYPSR